MLFEEYATVYINAHKLPHTNTQKWLRVIVIEFRIREKSVTSSLKILKVI